MPRTIKIKQYQFDLSEPFEPGHLLLPEEATALNALRAENIRNLLAPKVATVQQAHGEGTLLPSEAITGLRQEAARLDEEYRFGHRRSVPRKGAVEAEAQIIARALVLARARADRRELSEEQLASATALAALEEPVLYEARERVAEQQKIANVALEELLS